MWVYGFFYAHLIPCYAVDPTKSKCDIAHMFFYIYFILEIGYVAINP